MKLRLYPELYGDVRNDGLYYPIRSLVQPEDPEVREIAKVLQKAPDFIDVAHQFVHNFTKYATEQGDFWATPQEMLAARSGDCDDSAILLASLLRTVMPPEKVFVAIGEWSRRGDSGGHAWVIVPNEDGTDRILESTSSPNLKPYGNYKLEAMFNDMFAFATGEGLTDFDLIPGR